MKKIPFLLLICLLLAACAPIGAQVAAAQSEPTSASIIPNFDHIVLIVLENRDYKGVIGDATAMPHLNALAQQNVLLSNYFAVTHPSLPNYIALMSGGTQGITSDCTDCFVNQPNLADLIEASGRTWKAYLEDMPSPCFVGDSGKYAQKHNPLIYFDSIRLDATRCDRSILPLTSLDGDLANNTLPNFSFIMPNLCNSGHDCSAKTADDWVYNMVTKLQSSPALGNNSLIIITFDEGSSSDTRSCCGMSSQAGGHVATVLISPTAPPDITDPTPYSHYSLLKTILTAWNLPDLGPNVTAATAPIEAPWTGQLPPQVTPTPVPSTVPTSVPTAGLTPATSAPTPTVGPLAACVTSSPSSGGNSAKVCISDPAEDSSLTGDVNVSATVDVTGSPLGAQRVIFYLDGSYLLTSYSSPYTFILPTADWPDGRHVLSVQAILRSNFTTQRAGIPVTFANGVTTPPVNSGQFQPSTGIPATNGAPFVVAATGDGAGGELSASQVVNLIAGLHPNLLLYLGDVYDQGSLAEFYNWYGTSSTFFGQFRAITDPTVGNHEYLTPNATGYFDYWNNIPNYYSFDADGWHFVSLNSNTQYEPADPNSAQYQWLQQDLAANAQACTIVFYHQPLYNIGAEGSVETMTAIWKLMAQYGVDIVLNGHDHTYQRWVPLDGDGQPSPSGITEFVVGVGGHALHKFVTTDSRVAYSNDANPNAFGLLRLQLNQNGADFSYLSTNGSTLDSGVVPCVPAIPDTQAPTIPGGLSAKAVDYLGVSLTWTAARDDTGVAGYTIYRDGTQLATVPAASTSYTDKSVAPTTVYNYSIDAFDPAGNHSPASASVEIATPTAPTSLTFFPTADTYVNADSPGTNYGGSTALRIDSSPDTHAYLRFTVSGLLGRSVARARLLVYANSNGSQGVDLRTVAGSTWDELTASYSDAPSLGNILASSGAFSSGDWIALDVTQYISGEGTYNFGLTTSGSTAISLSSREAGANAPQLVLDLQR